MFYCKSTNATTDLQKMNGGKVTKLVELVKNCYVGLRAEGLVLRNKRSRATKLSLQPLPLITE